MKHMRGLLDLLGIDVPIVLAPMAGACTPELVAAVSNAGGLGSYGCAMLSNDQLAAEAARIRALTNRSFNLNFFCHAPPNVTAEQERAWHQKLAPYYMEFDVDPAATVGAARHPFGEEACEAVLAIGPKIVSFHFGMPKPELVKRLKDAGRVLISSATTSAEARRLVELGADVIVAQGFEAGGHRGMFLTSNVAAQVGTMALVPQVVDAVDVPVIAAGGIADARGAAAALALGAAAVQVGTAYLFCPEAKVSALHRAALRAARDDETVLTNLFTGRPARGLINRVIRELGPIDPAAPQFPMAVNSITPLRAEAERRGSSDFSPLWSGQAASLAREIGAAELTRNLADGVIEILTELGDKARNAQHARHAPAHG
jgi:nitronate monooxygenase